MKTFNLVTATSAILIVSGCATPEPLTATENSVSYEYDNNLVSSRSVAQSASAHCAKYGKKVELRSRTISSHDKWYTDIFDCK